MLPPQKYSPHKFLLPPQKSIIPTKVYYPHKNLMFSPQKLDIPPHKSLKCPLPRKSNIPPHKGLMFPPQKSNGLPCTTSVCLHPTTPPTTKQYPLDKSNVSPPQKSNSLPFTTSIFVPLVWSCKHLSPKFDVFVIVEQRLLLPCDCPCWLRLATLNQTLSICPPSLWLSSCHDNSLRNSWILSKLYSDISISQNKFDVDLSQVSLTFPTLQSRSHNQLTLSLW